MQVNDQNDVPTLFIHIYVYILFHLIVSEFQWCVLYPNFSDGKETENCVGLEAYLCLHSLSGSQILKQEQLNSIFMFFSLKKKKKDTSQQFTKDCKCHVEKKICE